MEMGIVSPAWKTCCIAGLSHEKQFVRPAFLQPVSKAKNITSKKAVTSFTHGKRTSVIFIS
ncbi:MAG: hypothetical protein JWO06_2305 [Bacteroidota bacterium]|nr:hypothetical protein [Bacteroidota bacterium]